ncbi:MAG: S41 family peptidase [Planctomycetota bacterium]|nr:S41 family peptidase [Planctomycetota bacterium]
MKVAPLAPITAIALLVSGLVNIARAQEQPPEPRAASVIEEQQRQSAAELELMMLFADTFEQIKRNYVRDVTDRELMEAAIKGMLSRLDQYSNFIPPERLQRFKSGVENEFGGIGIIVSSNNGRLEVISPLVGTPAYRAGMLPGDRILEIAGQSTKGLNIDGAINLMKGEIGSSVEVKILHPDELDPVVLKLKREVIRVPTVFGHRRNADDSWNYFCDQPRKIGYLRMTGFGRHSVAELRSAVENLRQQEMRGLVLDLRFNPGGLLSAAIQVCDMFVPEGIIVSTKGRNTPQRVWRARKAGTQEGFPMVVLINHFSASASEIVAACLQDHQRATIVGERSWGKGSVQNIIELENGRSALKLTTAGYRRPSGKNIHRFKDASDEDEWGVNPNDGFGVKFSGAENRALTTFRQQLDVVKRYAVKNAKPLPKFDDRQLAKALEFLTAQLPLPTAPLDERPPMPPVTP